MEILITIFRDYLVFINIFLAGVIIFFERRRPIYTLFWIMLLLLTSYFGFIIYLFFGLRFKKKNKLKKYYNRKIIKKSTGLLSKEYSFLKRWKELTHYLESVTSGEVTVQNEVEFFNDGKMFFKSLIAEIKNAKKEIFMEYYIFNDDRLGSTIYDLLLEKRKEKIKVKIIIDGAGTRGVSSKRIRELRENGIEIEVFFPSYFPFLKIGNLRANYRDHRKICLIDRTVCYTGGFNIGDEYIGEGKLGYWRDTGIRIYGYGVEEYYREFLVSWNFLMKDKKKKLMVDDTVFRDEFKNIEEAIPLQVVSSGPNYDYRNIRDTMIKMIMEAKKYIYIQTPYFVPDDAALEALKIAILSGVDVRVMIPHVPDHMFVYWANQSFYGEIIDLGAKIYRYENGFLHSKCLIVDDEIATLGTANFDYRSFYQNFEINMVVYGKKAVELKELFLEDIEKSDLVSKINYKNRKFSEKMKESISRLVAPIL
ncbi:cardiolipin synthase [Cetobacterium sp. SF1]|uniref:cardiolipin synthase n=1 Tax=unclassified Cetobacterium TaxID=2630983 RepID=UPI003CFBBF50